MQERAKRGVFWLIDDGELLACTYEENSVFGVSKSGNNYNHRLLWDHVKPLGCNKPYNYYPRGRVEISNKGKPIVYMNCNIGEDSLKLIMEAFELEEIPKVHYDGSEHYKCFQDRMRSGNSTDF